MARKTRSGYRTRSAGRSRSSRARGYQAAPRRRAGRTRGSSRRSGARSIRPQTLKIVIEQAAASAITDPFGQKVEKAVGKARF